MSDTEKLRAFCFDLADLMKPLRLFRINMDLTTTGTDALSNLYQTLGHLKVMTEKCDKIVGYDEDELEDITSVVELRHFIEGELKHRD